MTLTLVETKILATAIQMRYADNPDPTKAQERIDFQVKISDLVVPPHPCTQLQDMESHYLAVIRQAALRHVRDAIGDETQRLARLAGRND